MIQNIGYWIGPKGYKDSKNCHFLAQKSFSLDKIDENLELKIACESYYLLQINGITVGRGPARGTSTLYFYDTYPINSYLHIGTNTIKVEVLCMNIPTGRNIPIEPALWVEVGNLFGTNQDWEMALQDEEWPQDAPFYAIQHGYCEWRNLQKINNLTVVTTQIIPKDSLIYARKLVPSNIPLPVERVYYPGECLFPAWVPKADLEDKKIATLADNEEHFPIPEDLASSLHELTLGGIHNIQLPVPPNNGGLTVILNFNKMVSGRLEIDLDAPAGAIVDITYEEELYKENRLRGDHSATNPTYHFSDRYILKDGNQTIGNYLVERGFILVRLTFRNYQRPITIKSIRGVDRRYPVSLRSTFFCSDYTLNRLWETAFETLSACTTDIFTDCPWRERLFFINDFVVENRSGLQLFGDKRLLRHAYKMIFSEADENGIIPCVIPNSTPGLIYHGFPKDTSLGYILSSNLTLPFSLYEYYMYTQDASLVEENYNLLLKMMDTFRQWKNSKGILELPKRYCGTNNFFDWSFELNGCQIPSNGSSLMNYLYIIALKGMDKLKEVAQDTQSNFAEEIAQMQEATWREFYDQDKNFIKDCKEYIVNQEVLDLCGVPKLGTIEINSSKIAHALALLADENRSQSNLDMMKENLLSPKNFAPELFYGSFLLLAMKHHKLYNQAIDYIYQYWKPILDSGSSTLWENGVYYKGKAGFGGSASLCHGFSTSPVDFLQTTLLGITPIKPGFSEFQFAPVPCHLTFANGMVPTPNGTIRANWKIENDSIFAEIFVPPKTLCHTKVGDFGPGKHSFNWKI